MKNPIPPKQSLKLAPILALPLLLIIPLYFSFIGSSSNENLPQTLASPSHVNGGGGGGATAVRAECDLFTGEWVRDPEGPYYTNETCDFIQDHQNCMRYGRPDSDYLKWRWRPDECELERFDPARFLEMMRGKSLAFVGDSVARNHMQSLLCLLSRVARPVDLSEPGVQNKQYYYSDYAFNISIYWNPFLVKHGQLETAVFHIFDVYLDQPDDTWTTKLAPHDYVILSAGAWFSRPTYLHLNGRLHGCIYCPEPEANITHFPPVYAYRYAFRTAFRAINGAAGFDGVTFLRTYSPNHFEGGAWDKGGDCRRTRPFMRNETEVAVAHGSLEFYTVQVEEMRMAEKSGRSNGGKYVLFDATKAMMLRPDGHPSRYGHLPGAKLVMPNDCVHWCLPGPIDAWSDFLQELLKRETRDSL